MKIQSLFRQRVVAVCLLLLPFSIYTRTSKNAAEVQNEEVRQFRAFLGEDWEHWMHDYPELATAVGFSRSKPALDGLL